LAAAGFGFRREAFRTARFLLFTLTRERFRLAIDQSILEERGALKALLSGRTQARIFHLAEEPQAKQAAQDQINGDNYVEQPRDDKNKNTGDERNDRLQMRKTNGHDL
jgi:hypothetical protein